MDSFHYFSLRFVKILILKTSFVQNLSHLLFAHVGAPRQEVQSPAKSCPIEHNPLTVLMLRWPPAPHRASSRQLTPLWFDPRKVPLFCTVLAKRTTGSLCFLNFSVWKRDQNWIKTISGNIKKVCFIYFNHQELSPISWDCPFQGLAFYRGYFLCSGLPPGWGADGQTPENSGGVQSTSGSSVIILLTYPNTQC